MIQILQLILALSFLVIIHEFGHFTFARVFGVRVERFYLFFNYKFSLFRARKYNGKWHFRFFATNIPDAQDEQKADRQVQLSDEDREWSQHPESTEWGIGWIPFGGYCAIAGMVDETQSADKLKAEKQPWEFRSKNVFQRFLIIAGGILVNFVAALCIFALMIFFNGTDTLPLKNVDSGLYYSDILLQEGFEQQDKILSVNEEEPQTLGQIVQWMIIEGRRDVVVDRGGDTVRLSMSEDLGNRYLAFQNEYDRLQREKKRQDGQYKKSRFVLISEYYPFVIDSVFAGTAADMAGLAKGDSITAVDGVNTPCYALVTNELQQHPCDSVTIDFFRSGEKMSCRAFIGDQCKLGVIQKGAWQFFRTEHTDYTFWQSVPAGIKYGWDYLKMYVKQFRLVFSKEGAQSLGGFGAIGQMFPNTWNWLVFWEMTGILSLILAFMNFLPIPALDGGYLLFLLIEMLTGRQPSDKFLEKANNIGWILLLALLVFANGNDVIKWLFR